MSADTQQNIGTHAFQEASFIIDVSGIAEMVRHWLDEDGQNPELSDVDIQNVLAGWLGTAFAGLSLSEGNVVKLLNASSVAYRASEDDVRDITEQVLGAIDYRPLPARDKPMTKSMYEGVLQARAADAENLATKRQRYIEFTNAILRA